MDGFQFIGPDDVPDEIKQQILAQMDRQQMGLQTVAHDVQRLFRELDETQLGTLRFLVHTIAHNPEAGFYYEGILATLYSIKANICPACGKDHDKEAQEAMSPETLNDTSIDVAATARGIEYGVEFLDSSATSRVRCLGCGTIYVSLEDRMIQPAGPAGCSGCIQKTKWG